jgi:hypothetical protein
LTPVWVPDAVHEALRDPVRAREAAKKDLNHILFNQLREQFVSAAYLWLDTEIGKAFIRRRGIHRFSTAGKIGWIA